MCGLFNIYLFVFFINSCLVFCAELSFVKLDNCFVKINGGCMYKNGPGGKDTYIKNVSPFIVCDHRVTNKDYKDIMIWARDNGLKESVDILVPDYNVDSINRYGRYNINCGRLTDYFLDDKYNDYPVVGITYRQMLEYIRLKSKKDHVKYRLLSDDEYDFLIYEVRNSFVNGDLKIVQNDYFDDGFKGMIDFGNDSIKLENIKIREHNLKNKKSICGKKNIQAEKPLMEYDFRYFYNLRHKGLDINAGYPFYTNVYRYNPNGFLIYDLIGNLYEITCREKDLSEYCDVEMYDFILCGGSCFDFYESIIENVPKFYDDYDSVRFDRGFRLAMDV